MVKNQAPEKESAAGTVSELNLEGQLVIEDDPKYELEAEELIFPITIDDDGTEYMILIHMRPYTAKDIKKFLEDSSTKVKLGKDELTLKPDASPAYQFFWKYFIRMSGVEAVDESGEPYDPPVEEQVEWIKDNPRLKIEERIVMNGYGNVAIQTVEAPAQARFIIGKARDRKIRTTFELWNPDRERIDSIEIVHRFRRETEFDTRRHTMATGQSRMKTRKSEWMRVEDYTVVEHIYDDMIQEVTGVTLGGVECTLDNKDRWVGSIPFWWKHFVLAELFKGVMIKNA